MLRCDECAVMRTEGFDVIYTVCDHATAENVIGLGLRLEFLAIDVAIDNRASSARRRCVVMNVRGARSRLHGAKKYGQTKSTLR